MEMMLCQLKVIYLVILLAEERKQQISELKVALDEADGLVSCERCDFLFLWPFSLSGFSVLLTFFGLYFTDTEDGSGC